MLAVGRTAVAALRAESSVRGAPERKDNVYVYIVVAVLLRVGSAEARAGRCGMLGDVVHSRRVVLSVAAAEAAGESQGDHLE